MVLRGLVWAVARLFGLVFLSASSSWGRLAQLREVRRGAERARALLIERDFIIGCTPTVLAVQRAF